MEESTNQSNHITNCVRVKPSNTNLKGETRINKYILEQLYNVIDSRYRSQKPLIVTTNLTLQELQNPKDTAHARIYDRVLKMCVPVHFSGVSRRKEQAQARLEKFRERLQ